MTFDPFADWSRADVPRLRVSLRVQGDALDPDFLTQLMGVPPTESAHEGDPGEPRGAGHWTYRLDAPEDTELGSAVESLLAVFPDDTTLWEELTSSFTVALVCDLFLAGDAQRTDVDPDVLAALGRRGLGLHLELHTTGSDDEDG